MQTRDILRRKGGGLDELELTVRGIKHAAQDPGGQLIADLKAERRTYLSGASAFGLTIEQL